MTRRRWRPCSSHCSMTRPTSSSPRVGSGRPHHRPVPPGRRESVRLDHQRHLAPEADRLVQRLPRLQGRLLDDIVPHLIQDQYQTSEVVITASSRGWRIAEQPTMWHPRASGESKKGGNLVFGFSYARVIFMTWARVTREFARGADLRRPDRPHRPAGRTAGSLSPAPTPHSEIGADHDHPARRLRHARHPDDGVGRRGQPTPVHRGHRGPAHAPRGRLLHGGRHLARHRLVLQCALHPPRGRTPATGTTRRPSSPTGRPPRPPRTTRS